MPTINQTNPTLLDLAQRMDPAGNIVSIVESLQQQTPLLEDITFVEGNLPTGHVFTHRVGLPSLEWRRFNQGISPSKSKVAQITETAGTLSGRSVVDTRLAALNGNAAAFRASEDRAFVQKFSHAIEESIFYSSTAAAPEQIQGLAPRLDSTTEEGGEQIFLHQNAGAPVSGQCTSIYVVCWSPETVFGFVPKGMAAGLQSKDMGEQYVPDEDGKEFIAYCTDWNWNLGLAIKDRRYVVRIANIDTAQLSATSDNLLVSVSRAIEEKLQGTNMGRCAIYANRTITSMLRQQAVNRVKGSTLSLEQVNGKPVTMMDGLPIRRTDALLNTEAVVS